MQDSIDYIANGGFLGPNDAGSIGAPGDVPYVHGLLTSTQDKIEAADKTPYIVGANGVLVSRKLIAELSEIVPIALGARSIDYHPEESRVAQIIARANADIEQFVLPENQVEAKRSLLDWVQPLYAQNVMEAAVVLGVDLPDSYKAPQKNEPLLKVVEFVSL